MLKVWGKPVPSPTFVSKQNGSGWEEEWLAFLEAVALHPGIAAWLAGRWGVVTAPFQPYKLENKEIFSLSDPKLSP